MSGTCAVPEDGGEVRHGRTIPTHHAWLPLKRSNGSRFSCSFLPAHLKCHLDVHVGSRLDRAHDSRAELAPLKNLIQLNQGLVKLWVPSWVGVGKTLLLLLWSALRDVEVSTAAALVLRSLHSLQMSRNGPLRWTAPERPASAALPRQLFANLDSRATQLRCSSAERRTPGR